MQTNNWVDFVILSLFMFAVIFIGLPASFYLFKKGFESFVKYKFSKLPTSFSIVPGFGNYSIEIICYGLFIFAFSVWYLFFDKGGQLENFLEQAKHFWG